MHMLLWYGSRVIFSAPGMGLSTFDVTGRHCKITALLLNSSAVLAILLWAENHRSTISCLYGYLTFVVRPYSVPDPYELLFETSYLRIWSLWLITTIIYFWHALGSQLGTWFSWRWYTAIYIWEPVGPSP